MKWAPKFVLFFLISFSLCSWGQEKCRVFITDSQSWETRSSGGGTSAGFGGESHGGARPQTAEIIKTFGEKCSQVTVTSNKDKANYAVVLDHEGGKGWLQHKNKVAVFNREGDAIVSKSTLSLGGSVEEACGAIMRDWDAHPETHQIVEKQALASNSTGESKPQPKNAAIQVNSSPIGADIEIDGNFVGNTPSTVEVSPGDHVVTVKKNGFKDWSKKMKVSGGQVNLNAELEKLP